MEDLSKFDLIKYNLIVEAVEAGNRLEADKNYEAALEKYFFLGGAARAKK